MMDEKNNHSFASFSDKKEHYVAQKYHKLKTIQLTERSNSPFTEHSVGKHYQDPEFTSHKGGKEESLRVTDSNYNPTQ